MKKYNFIWGEDGCRHMQECVNGDYYKVSDVEALEKELKNLKEKINNLNTYDLDYSGHGFSSHCTMEQQQQKIGDRYCGDYVDSCELREVLK